MALLNSILSSILLVSSVSGGVSEPFGLWEWLILNVFYFIGNYGWRIVVFILTLKFILLPLDIFQRYKMRKNAKITQELKPHMDKLKRQYADDPRMLSSKQMELNRKSGYSYFSSCIPMILTLVIFISLFSGMRNISQYMIFRQYAAWYDTYIDAIAEYETINIDFSTDKAALEADIAELDRLIAELEAEDVIDYEQMTIYLAERLIKETDLDNLLQLADDYAQDKVVEYNDENADSFALLGIKSLWQPDVLWARPIHASKNAFVSSVGDYGKISKDKGDVGEEVLSDMLNRYDAVTKKLVNSPENKQNGYMVLVILAFLFSIGSQFIMQKLQKKSGQFDSGAGVNTGVLKFMMFLMPAIMAFFAMQYTAAFALYMVVNSGMTIIINLTATMSMNLFDKRQTAKAEDVVISYGRPDPNAANKPRLGGSTSGPDKNKNNKNKRK